MCSTYKNLKMKKKSYNKMYEKISHFKVIKILKKTQKAACYNFIDIN